MVDACFECGICCKLFLINLNKEEYNSSKYKTQFEEFGLVDDFEEAELCGSNIIKQQKDGSCIYLKPQKSKISEAQGISDSLVKGKCSIHLDRPKACRAFFCNSKNKDFKVMIKDINKYKNSLK